MSTLAERFTTRLPFVVGVTGHRQIDPSDEPRLHAEVRRILDDLRARMPETPILVLCGMATGSDMICAEEALAAGATLCALLPAPLELFERDLNAVEREQLHAALERAAEVRVLDAALEPGYVRLAEYIARYSHLVLALWDGAEGRGSGGTADVVSMRVEGLHLDRRLARLGIETQAYPDVGPIVHIPTRRAGGPPVSGETDLRHPPRFEGDSTAKRDYDAATAHLERFNRDLRVFGVRARGAVSLHAAVDTLSNVLQKRIMLVTNALYVLGAIAATVHILREPNLWRTTVLAVALVAFGLARRLDLENRYQDYRALAEALRVREAWALGGIAASVEACYLRMYQSELQWIRMALRTVDLVEPIHVAGPVNALEGPCGIWLQSQWRYYRDARAREDRSSRRLDVASRSLFVAGGLCVVLAGVLPQLALRLHNAALSAFAVPFVDQGQTLFALAVAYGAFLSSYSVKRAFAANAKRYERMFFVFDTVKRRLASLPPDAAREVEAIILEVGREALVEHADWLLQRRDRPLSFVQG